MSKLRNITAICQETVGANSQYLELSRDHKNVGDIEITALNYDLHFSLLSTNFLSL